MRTAGGGDRLRNARAPGRCGVIGTALLPLLLAACRTSPEVPARHPADVEALLTESADSGAAAFRPLDPAEYEGIALEDPGPYRLGVGDVVHVTVPGSVDFKGFGESSQGDILGSRIKDDGNLYLPILRMVPAAGRTVLELQEDIRVKLEEGPLKGALVSVDVIQYNSQTVHVFGQVGQPGPLPVDGRLTLRDAIGRAGGADPSMAALDEAYVVRDGRHVLPVSLYDVFHRAHPLGTLRLRSGDVVYVPRRRERSFHVYVLGEVGTPSAIDMRRGVGRAGEPTPPRLTLADAIAQAGGLNGESADHNCVRIFRGTCADVRAFTISAHEIWRYGEGILLHPGDRVLVAPVAEADFKRALEESMPLMQAASTALNFGYAAALLSK